MLTFHGMCTARVKNFITFQFCSLPKAQWSTITQEKYKMKLKKIDGYWKKKCLRGKYELYVLRQSIGDVPMDVPKLENGSR